MEKTPATTPNYTFVETSDENVQKVVDRSGNWTHYYLVKEKRYVKGVTHILKLGYAKGSRFHEWLLSVSKEEAKKKLEEAGDEGTRTHMAIRDLIMGRKLTREVKYPSDTTGRQEVLTDSEWDSLMAFQGFCDKYKPQSIAQEFILASNDFAGTADYLCTITVPKDDKTFPAEVRGQEILLLPDWKTSSAIYDEYQAQLAAYFTMALNHPIYRKYFTKDKPWFTGVLRLGSKHKCGYEFQVWDAVETAENERLFYAAKVIADKAQPEFNPEIIETPNTIVIKVPKAALPVKQKKHATSKKRKARRSVSKGKPTQPPLGLGETDDRTGQ